MAKTLTETQWSRLRDSIALINLRLEEHTFRGGEPSESLDRASEACKKATGVIAEVETNPNA